MSLLSFCWAKDFGVTSEYIEALTVKDRRFLKRFNDLFSPAQIVDLYRDLKPDGVALG